MRIAFTPSHPLHDEVTTREDELVTQRLSTVQSWISQALETVDSICPLENILSDEWMVYTLTTGAVGSRAWRDRADEGPYF